MNYDFLFFKGYEVFVGDAKTGEYESVSVAPREMCENLEVESDVLLKEGKVYPYKYRGVIAANERDVVQICEQYDSKFVSSSNKTCEVISTTEEMFHKLVYALNVDKLPDECKGETYAICFEYPLRADGYSILSTSSCIEQNWEQRGPYWIIDCLSENKRLVFSESLHYYKEFPIEQH